jgi:Flp pilus assembly protein CpaB
MRNIYFFLAALLSFGVAWFYWNQVSERTATVTKLRLVAEDGLVVRAGTEIDEEFLARFVVAQPIPVGIADQFGWALDDTAVTRINLVGRTLGQDLNGGSFLMREHFFVPQEDEFARRIQPGNRAFSIPVQSDRAVENFVLPGARVDVIGVFEQADGSMLPERMLDNVIVMAVDGLDSIGAIEAEGTPGFNTVTLQAPAAATEAFLARAELAKGELSLVLRNPCEDPADCAAPEPEADPQGAEEAAPVEEASE